MMELTLMRTQGGAGSPDGTFGLLTAGHVQLQTVEDDWRDNQPGESCIPAGRYRLHRSWYHHGSYEVFEITNVPGRQRILIHVANTENDVKGCVGVGTRRGKLWVPDEDDPAHPMTWKQAVVGSKEAFGLLMKELEHVDEADLVIQWAHGLP